MNVGEPAAIAHSIKQHLCDHPALWTEPAASSDDFPLPVSKTLVQDIASAVLNILRNPEMARKMGQRNVAVARERADLDIQFERFESIAAKLIDKYKTESGVGGR